MTNKIDPTNKFAVAFKGCTPWAIFLLIFGLALVPLHAQTDGWAGGGATDLWSDGGNWGSGLPQAGDNLVFDALPPGRFTTSEDDSAPTLGSITFTPAAPAYTLSVKTGGSGTNANTLTISGAGITSNSTNTQTIITAGETTASGNGARGGVLNLTNNATLGNVLITNQGGQSDNVGYGETVFNNQSSAGTATIVCAAGPGSGDFGGLVHFNDTTTAGSATFTVEGGRSSSSTVLVVGGSTAAEGGGDGAEILFENGTHAATATFTANGRILFFGANADQAHFTLNGATDSLGQGGSLEFNGYGLSQTPARSSAGSAVIVVNGASAPPIAQEFYYTGSQLTFSDSDAAQANITVNGGSNGGDGGEVLFDGTSAADTATITVNAGGTFDMYFESDTPLTVGTLAGAGTINIEYGSLLIGSLNTDATLSGPIVDAGGGTRGSLTKVGTGKVTLSGANTYGGGTTVNAGTLLIEPASLASSVARSADGKKAAVYAPADIAASSGAGTGLVTVNAGGTLGGSGTIAGAVVNTGGTVAPGNHPGTLTLGSTYTQLAGGTLLIQIADSGTAGADYDQLVVNGAASLDGTLQLVLMPGYTPEVGDTFQIIQAASVTGNFAQIVSPGLTVSLASSASGLSATIVSVGESTTPPPVVKSDAATATVGQPFSYQIQANGTPSGYTATGLPPGLTLNAAGGVISGAPTTAGIFSVALTATNVGGTGTGTLTLTVMAVVATPTPTPSGSPTPTPPASPTPTPTPVLAPAITSVTTASAEVGISFAYQILASNSPASYSVSGLPAGLSLNTASGLIAGTPVAAGTFDLVLSAINAGGTGTLTLTLTVTAAIPTITVATIGDGQAVEGGESGKVKVVRTGDTSAALTVSYKLAGAAKGGVDYKALSGSVTIPAGVSQVKIKIKPIDNAAADGTRVVKLKLKPSIDGSYSLGSAATAKIKIIDND